ncbi:MAG: protein kinase family protein [Candidatus Moraniibacteriota bacterium]|nr:MAG: protein kinase family protein [Candidatus Moranbacteria bacterium]
MAAVHFKINKKFQSTTDRGPAHEPSLWLVSLAEKGGGGGGNLIKAALERPLAKDDGGSGTVYFMKSWTSDSPSEYGTMMQELEILRTAAAAKSSAIVGLIASQVSIQCIRIVLEYAPSGTMRTRYFPEGKLVLDANAAIGSDAHIRFLRDCCEPFFREALQFMHHTVKRVYCDWKFDNILCFDGQAGPFPRLKLADFSSVQQIGRPIVNPKNCNQAYTPPTLCAELDKICPCPEDDYVSVRYLFAKLNGLQLSWEAVARTIDEMTSVHYIMIALLKTELFTPFDVEKTIYWPAFLLPSNN